MARMWAWAAEQNLRNPSNWLPAWSVHIGPLYGSCSKKPSENTLQKNFENSERGPDPAQPAGTRRAKKQASIRKPV